MQHYNSVPGTGPAADPAKDAVYSLLARALVAIPTAGNETLTVEMRFALVGAGWLPVCDHHADDLWQDPFGYRHFDRAIGVLLPPGNTCEMCDEMDAVDAVVFAPCRAEAAS